MASLVDVVDGGGFGELSGRIEEALLKALDFLGKEGLVEVSLVTDSEMARINKETRGKEGPTAVLSFEEPEEIPQPEVPQLGEIYLAPGVIEGRGMDPVKVAIHGLLHLLGYTHERESDTMRMENLEKRIWQILSQD